jgi:hypothetical protein
MHHTASDASRDIAVPGDRTRAGVTKALFVRLTAKAGKGDEVEAFLRGGLEAVLESMTRRRGMPCGSTGKTLRSSTPSPMTQAATPT